jgi:hypothetical protein
VSRHRNGEKLQEDGEASTENVRLEMDSGSREKKRQPKRGCRRKAVGSAKHVGKEEEARGSHEQ